MRQMYTILNDIGSCGVALMWCHLFLGSMACRCKYLLLPLGIGQCVLLVMVAFVHLFWQ